MCAWFGLVIAMLMALLKNRFRRNEEVYYLKQVSHLLYYLCVTSVEALLYFS